MPIVFQTKTTPIDSSRDPLHFERNQTVLFANKTVLNAQVALVGFSVKFDNGDHHIEVEHVGFEHVHVTSPQVKWDVFLGLRDGDKNPYSGSVTALIIAEVK